jgi:electron transfer flavoprotein alpha subunit
MAEILVFSEHRDTALELVAAARQLGAELGMGVCGAALGGESAAWAADLAAQGAARVFTSDDPALEGLPIDTMADALAQLVSQAGASVVLLGSTRRGRELSGRLAQRLGAGCVSDVTGLVVENGELVAGRYNLGGATVQRETVTTPVKVFAVMPKTFEAGSPAGSAGAVEPASLTLKPSAVKVVERRPREGGAVNLDAAPRIVGVGRGLRTRDDVALGESLAAALEAELACTKSLADFGWLPEDRIVGLSGAKTKPDLYLAVGVSGQIQHTVGVSGARVIAAINTDKDAPIFALADYGIVGDLYEVLPALVERLGAL